MLLGGKWFPCAYFGFCLGPLIIIMNILLVYSVFIYSSFSVFVEGKSTFSAYVMTKSPMVGRVEKCVFRFQFFCAVFLPIFLAFPLWNYSLSYRFLWYLLSCWQIFFMIEFVKSQLVTIVLVPIEYRYIISFWKSGLLCTLFKTTSTYMYIGHTAIMSFRWM